MMQTNGYDKLETEELFKLYRQRGDIYIKQEIVMRYSSVVKTIAMQLRGVYASFAEMDDIINEGIITLMQAVDRFDPEKNVKFETYASLRVRGAIVDLARKHDWVPRSVRKLGKAIDAAYAELYYELGRHPQEEEIAQKLGISVEKYQKALGETNLFNILSLDALVDGLQEDGQTDGFLRDKSEESLPSHAIEQRELSWILKKSVDRLKDNEKMVISLYYEQELSMKEIARVMSISEPRVSQLHSQALKKLRMDLTDYVSD